jgi:hypothetical protein
VQVCRHFCVMLVIFLTQTFCRGLGGRVGGSSDTCSPAVQWHVWSLFIGARSSRVSWRCHEARDTRSRAAYSDTFVTETNRIHLALIGAQNRTLGP